jgi:DNA-binding LytR/AlgR family response regulator
MQYSYIHIDGSQEIESTLESISVYNEFMCVAVCRTRTEGINKILELKPDLVFLNISVSQEPSFNAISLSLLSELHEFLDVLPTIIVLNTSKDQAFESYQRGVSGYLLYPIDPNELRKCLLRYQKTHNAFYADKISIKSNGDYHFITTQNIVYLKADNNTTDFYLQSGKVITAFKTLKHFEQLLPFYFFRIHHGYVINVNHVSRINLGKSRCYLLNNEFSVPFSRTYKEAIDTIIIRIS